MHDKLQLGISLLLIVICLGIFGFFIFRSNQPPAVVETESTETQLIQSPTQTTDSITFDTTTLYNLINGFRKEENLPELRVHPALERSARAKLQNMIDEEYWRHEDRENVQSWYLFKEAGYSYTVAGENLAFGLSTPWDVFDGWLQSSRHKQELMTAAYGDMGLAVDCTTYKQAGKPTCITVLHLGSD